MGALCCPNAQQDRINNPYSLPTIPDEFTSKLINPQAFEYQQILGKGAFGKVFLAKKINNGKFYAMKVIKKSQLQLPRRQTYAKNERNVLAQIQSPFIVQLHYAFQTFDKLYLAMDYCQGGDLYKVMRAYGKLSVKQIKFYACELILALEALHKNGYVYRDLKPENILIAEDGHIKLADFNLAKYLDDKSRTICGTPEYIAPEVLERQPHDTSIDFWGIGVFIYEAFTGKSPFKTENMSELFTKILANDYEMPEDASDELKDLIDNLLQRYPQERLCDFKLLKEHKFFENEDWGKYEQKQILPPLIMQNLFQGSQYPTSPCSPINDWNQEQKVQNIYEKFTYTETPINAGSQTKESSDFSAYYQDLSEEN